MKHRVSVALALILLASAGCASRTDWIESTLVTADVTGVWRGVVQGAGTVEVELVLEQRGPKVDGLIRIATQSGSVQGTVEGDVFRFAQRIGSVKGEVTVAEDEMVGDLFSATGLNIGGRGTLRLSRVASPAGEPRRPDMGPSSP